jgi:hypothetical protein
MTIFSSYQDAPVIMCTVPFGSRRDSLEELV